MSTEETRTAANEELWRIAETDHIDQVDSLLEKGADINSSNEHGMTALMRATSSGRVRMVSVLLAHGADPNASRTDKFTPLLLASFFGHEEIVKILVEHGADAAATSSSETSAQMWATSRNFFDVVDYLEQPRNPNENAELPVDEDGPSVTPPPPELPTIVEKTESVKPWYLQPPQSQRLPVRERLKWGLVGFAGALAFVLMMIVTDRVMRRDESLTPPPTPIQSTEVQVDSTGLTEAPNDLTLTPPDVTKTEKAAFAPKENPPEKKQNQLQTKTSTRGETSTAESLAPETAAKQNEGTKVSLPERSSTEAQSTESATRQPAPSRERSATTPPVPTGNQLLTGSRSSTPPGKVIRWP